MQAPTEPPVSLRSAQPISELALNALYRQQWWPMLRLAQGLVDDVAAAEDVVQDAFVRLLRAQTNLREAAAVASYLRISVVNGARSVLRRRRIARSRLSLLAPRTETSAAADQSSLHTAEQLLARRALARLPRRQREVLTLRYLADLNDTEIAEATGMSAGNVRSAASRGLAALRKSYGEQL